MIDGRKDYKNYKITENDHNIINCVRKKDCSTCNKSCNHNSFIYDNPDFADNLWDEAAKKGLIYRVEDLGGSDVFEAGRKVLAMRDARKTAEKTNPRPQKTSRTVVPVPQVSYSTIIRERTHVQ